MASSEVLLVQPCDKERKIQTLGSDEEYVCYLSMYDYTNLLWRAFLKGAWQKLRRLPSQKEIPLVYDVFRIALNYAPASQTCAYILRWLQYHDRGTNNLPGMLPLAIGMPVALTEHLDRGKQLLRGSVGHVHSWQWNDNDRRPSTVYVKFPEAEWMLDGINELGVYPIRPVKREWYLDHGRDRPTLKVQRTQVPLTPAYAMTTHSSQGKTLKAVLLDMAFDKRAPPTIGLVAATRVRSREGVLILRPFNGDLFRRGAPEGPRLLLEKLRGDQIHWDRLRDARKPSAKCSNCAEIKTLDFFSDWQWDQIRANKPAMCRLCKDGLPGSRKLEKEAESYQCCGCLMEKVEDAFPRAQLKQMDAETTRRCLQCLHAYTETLHCCRCKEIKALEYFEPDMLTMPAYATACKVCQQDSTRGAADEDQEMVRVVQLPCLWKIFSHCSGRRRRQGEELPQLCKQGAKDQWRADMPEQELQTQVDRGEAAWPREAAALLPAMPAQLMRCTETKAIRSGLRSTVMEPAKDAQLPMHQLACRA